MDGTCLTPSSVEHAVEQFDSHPPLGRGWMHLGYTSMGLLLVGRCRGKRSQAFSCRCVHQRQCKAAWVVPSSLTLWWHASTVVLASCGTWSA